MSIRAKLVAVFLAVIISTMAVSALFFVNTRGLLKDLWMEEVTSIADLKKDKINAFFAEQEKDVKSFQNFFMVKKYLPVISKYYTAKSNPAYVDAKKLLDSRLKSFQALGYTDVILTDQEGKMVYATNEAHQAKHLGRPLSELEGNAFKEGRKGIYYSDIFRNTSDDNNTSMLVVAPLHDFEGKFIGVVALDKNMAEFYGSIQDAAGLGKTGETLIGKRVGDEIMILNPLRHDPDAAMERKIVVGSKVALALQMAAQGQDGAGVTVDYRGKEVVSAWRHLPSSGWGLVVKVDESETLLPLRRLERIAVLLGIIIIATAAAAVFITSKYITKPIIELQAGTEIIGSGNLGHKVGTPANDEIGQLSRAFDRMTESLKMVTASRDELRDSENRLKSIMDNIPDIAWLKDVEYRYEAVNESFARMCGLSPEDIIGKTDLELWSTRLAEKYRADDMDIVSSGKRKVIEEQIIGKDGRGIWAETIKSPIYNDNGRLLGTVGIARDISERKSLEQRKADFYAMVTHDIKSPLSAMLGYSELILADRSGTLDPEAREMVIAVLNSGTKLNDMVEEFLSISRLEAGKLVARPVPSDISQTLIEAYSGLEGGIRKKGLDLRVLIAEGLPSKVMIDPKLVQRAVGNMLQNALNYTPSGGTITLGLDSTADKDNDAVVVSVSDTGPGIPAEEQDMIFEKYYRSPRTAGTKGTGLGLAIVKAVAEAHGGRVVLESVAGKGSTFRLILPVASRPA